MVITDKTKWHPFSIFATLLRLYLKLLLFYHMSEWWISSNAFIIQKYITVTKVQYALLLLACACLYWLVNSINIETHKTETVTKANGDKVITGWKCKWW